MIQFNPKLEAAMKDARNYGAGTWDLLAALRGPDSENPEEKRRFTAPIRLWMVGKEQYGKFCLPVLRDVTPLTREHTKRLLGEIWDYQNMHYLGHIWSALREIQRLEGWE